MRHLHRQVRLDLDEARRRVVEISKHHELPVNPDAFIWQLSVGEQQRVELVKTLCLGAKLLILDEPTSALTPQETDDLLDRLQRMTAELSIIFISHKLAEVKALSRKVTILRQGRSVFSGEHRRPHHRPARRAHDRPRGLHPQEPRAAARPRPAGPRGRDLKVRGDRGNFALDGLSLDVRAGEIVGLAGVSGNGQRELAAALAGLRPVESGAIELEGAVPGRRQRRARSSTAAWATSPRTATTRGSSRPSR